MNVDKDTVRWAADEFARLELLGIRDLNKQRDAAESVLKTAATANPELVAIETTDGRRILVKRGSVTVLNQPAIKVFLGKDLAQYQKSSPTVSLTLEPAAAAATTETPAR